MKTVLVVAAFAVISGQALAQSGMPGAPATPAAPSQPVAPVTPIAPALTHNQTLPTESQSSTPKTTAAKPASPELEPGWVTTAWPPNQRFESVEQSGLPQPTDVLAIARTPVVNPISTAAAYSSVKLTPSLRQNDTLIFGHSGFFRATKDGHYVFQISVARTATGELFSRQGTRCAARLSLNGEPVILKDFGDVEPTSATTPAIGGVDLEKGYFKIEWAHWCNHWSQAVPASLSSFALKVRSPDGEDMEPVTFLRAAKSK